jgi:hypothetical protein
MLLDGIGDLNWLAVIVSAAAYYVLGIAWYMPQVLGKQWMASVGMDPEDDQPSMYPITFVIPAVAYIVTAAATGLLVVALGYADFVDGLVLGLVVGIGYAVAITAVTANDEPSKPAPWIWFLIVVGYDLLGIVIVAVVLTLWR